MTGRPASAAAFRTTGRVRQEQQVHSDPSGRRIREHWAYQAAYQRVAFIRSAQVPVLAAVLIMLSALIM